MTAQNSIDLSKLTPGPYSVSVEKHDDKEAVLNISYGEPGRATTCWRHLAEIRLDQEGCMGFPGVEASRTNFDVIAALLNDLEVKQRRGWHTERCPHKPGYWYVPQFCSVVNLTDVGLEAYKTACYQEGHDVGLLTKADAFAKEHRL